MAGAKTWLVMGAFVGAMAVAFGAFGAHSLPQFFEAMEFTLSEREKGLRNWETAAQYQMYHAIALIVLGLYASKFPGLLPTLAGYSFFFGQLIFSGLLYALVLSKITILGAIVPIGGTLMIVGWVLFGIAAWRNTEVATTQPLSSKPEAPPKEELAPSEAAP